MHAVSVVEAVGGVELAVGATSGWLLALAVDRPTLVERFGVRSVRRVGQAHLDLIIMGVLLIALGLAAPHLPTLGQVLLIVGAWVNPLLFVPLAFRPEMVSSPSYKAASVVSFACMTAGTVWAAVYLVG